MTQKERMLAGIPYLADDGAELDKEREECRVKLYALNNIRPEERCKIPSLLKGLLGGTGEKVFLEPPFYCEFGNHIFVGENFFANFHLTFLDMGEVHIGKNAQIGPNVSIYTAGHPIHPEARATEYEYGISVEIGDDVWIGGDSVILPGVKIGSGSVIGAGSVVTKDIPSMVVAAGNPARVIRPITDEDKLYYFKKRKFVFPFEK